GNWFADVGSTISGWFGGRRLSEDLALADATVVLDGSGPLQRIPRTGDGAVDAAAVAALLAEVKSRMPQEQTITLLLEPQVAYEDLVRVMDAVRVMPDDPDAPMFPDIAIGEAAPAEAS
ncbi:MAG: hypothetical protein ACPGE9_11460, partial [Algiphilus sp.]